jgi:hypothetical protein
LFQRLQRISKTAALGFADQNMNVLGHNDVAVDAKSETAPDSFNRLFKNSLRCDCVE